VVETLASDGADDPLRVRVGVSRQLHRRRAVRPKPFASRILSTCAYQESRSCCTGGSYRPLPISCPRWLVVLSILLTVRSSIRAVSRSASRNPRVATSAPGLGTVAPQPPEAHWLRPAALGLLTRVWRGWRSAVVIVKPETVLTWHRRGFRLLWAWKSRHRPG
jgi:hypothetical protein